MLQVDQKRKLNLGCGRDQRPDWVNVDIRTELRPDAVVDLERALPWMEMQFQEVYACHVVEHIANWRQLLGECWRILIPEGRLVIRVPDFEYALERYLKGDPCPCTYVDSTGEPQEITWEHLIWGEYRDRVKGYGHVFGFAFENGRPNDLAIILRDLGFRRITRVDTGLPFEIKVEAYRHG